MNATDVFTSKTSKKADLFHRKEGDGGCTPKENEDETKKKKEGGSLAQPVE